MTTTWLGAGASVITSRPLRDRADVDRVADVLGASAGETLPGWNWDAHRWARFALGSFRAEPAMQLWHEAGSRPVGLVHAAGQPGWTFLQLDPDYRWIEEDMVRWAEANLAEPAHDGLRRLHCFVYDYDLPRRALLQRRGYAHTRECGHYCRVRLGNPGARIQPPAGCTVRDRRPEDGRESLEIAALPEGGIFGTPGVRGAAEAKGPAGSDLDLVVDGPEGSVVGFAGLSYDPSLRRGTVAPVLIRPDHRHLAWALVAEGARRLRLVGATDAYFEVRAMDAEALLSAVGPLEAHCGAVWQRTFD